MCIAACDQQVGSWQPPTLRTPPQHSMLVCHHDAVHKPEYNLQAKFACIVNPQQDRCSPSSHTALVHAAAPDPHHSILEQVACSCAQAWCLNQTAHHVRRDVTQQQQPCHLEVSHCPGLFCSSPSSPQHGRARRMQPCTSLVPVCEFCSCRTYAAQPVRQQQAGALLPSLWSMLHVV